MEEFSYALIWLGFFASIVLGLYFYLSARHKERMSLIEKNVDVSEILKVREIHFPWFKLGMIITGVGFGACLAIILSHTTFQNMDGGSRTGIILGFMLFFGGLGLVIAYFLEKPKGL